MPSVARVGEANGRVYDPIMAQFLSPDPFIQSPGNWYNYNRYGYCLNNPLIYNDPSGEIIGSLLAIWAGNYLINSVAYAINNNTSLKTAFKATPIVGGVGFSPTGFVTGQSNMGFSHPQLDAHLAVKNEIRVSRELDNFISNVSNVWAEMDFVAEGNMDISVGLQFGMKSSLFGLGEIEYKFGHYSNLATFHGDLKNFEFSGGWAEENRAHTLVGGKLSFLKNKFGFGGYYDWNYKYYTGADGSYNKYKGSDQYNWDLIFLNKNFGPKVKLIDKIIEDELSINVKMQNLSKRTFYGVDLGGSIRFLFGVDGNFKIGFNY